jgi:hypothetical protein
MVRGNRDSLHEVVKDMVSRWGLEHGYWFTQEDKAYQDLAVPHRPDVVLHANKPHASRHPLVIVEVQRKIDRDWLRKMRSQYEGQCYILIPLQYLDDTHQSAQHLKLLVSVQMDCETERYVAKRVKQKKKPSRKKERKKWECVCGFKGNKWPHAYNCEQSRREYNAKQD